MSNESANQEAALADRFEHVADLETTDSGPPVEQWDPPFTGDLDVVVARDGRWFHEGREMSRQALKALFASIMRLESDGEYYLVTPVEKFRIRVEDAPFIAHTLEVEGEGSADQVLWLRTNMNQHLAVGDRHPLTVRRDPETGEETPYVLVRRNLQARVERNAFYHLVERAEERPINGRTHLGVASQGSFFSLGEAD